MNSVQKLREEGLREGLEKGLEKGLGQGVDKGRREMFLEVLTDQFDVLPADIVARVRQSDDEALARYRKRFATADSLAAVFAEE